MHTPSCWRGHDENVTIDGKALTLEGFGGANGVGGAILNGSITETGALNGALTIDGIVINAAGQQDGISLAPTLAAAALVTISNVSITGASETGLALDGGGTSLGVSVQNSSFFGNGIAKTFGGSGDLSVRIHQQRRLQERQVTAPLRVPRYKTPATMASDRRIRRSPGPPIHRKRVV